MNASAGNAVLPVRDSPGVRALPRSIWVLGWVSLLMDMSSELIHSLLPILMATVLGASMATIGLIEGMAEATAAVTKVFSGAISDHFRKRKFLVLLGYGLAAVTKPVFPLAPSITWVVGARLVDRVGKGIRGAPRDALIADITPAGLRGAAYGLRQALDSVGAFLGPLIAVGLMLALAGNIRPVLWWGAVPAVIAVMLLAVAVREPDPADASSRVVKRPLFADVTRLSTRYWSILALGAVFTLARFSEAFLILRARDAGIAATFVPAIMVIMNVVYAALAFPSGVWADRVSARKLLIVGLGVLVAADLVLACASRVAIVLAGAALWGGHMALTQGLLSKLVADTAPASLRGTAFGMFNLTTGVALLLASTIAGILWKTWGAPATFLAGAGFAAAAAVGLLIYRPASRERIRDGLHV